MQARELFMIAICSMMIPSLYAAFVHRNLLPMIIWVIAIFVLMLANSQRNRHAAVPQR